MVSRDIATDLSSMKSSGISSVWDYIINGEIQNAYLDSHRRFGFRTQLIRTAEQVSLLQSHKKNKY